MKRGYNLAVVFVRVLALASIALGIMWCANLLGAVALSALGAPEWLMNGIWNYAVAGILGGPIWLAAGLLALRYSEPLAVFIAKATKDTARPPPGG